MDKHYNSGKFYRYISNFSFEFKSANGYNADKTQPSTLLDAQLEKKY